MRNELTARPKTVSIAVLIMTIMFAATVVLGAISISKEGDIFSGDSPMMVAMITASMLLVFCLFSYTIYSISKCRNWARILFSLFFVFSIIATIVDIYSNSEPFNILNTLQLVVDAVCFVLLYVKPSTTWFRENKRHIVYDAPVQNV